MLRLSVVFQVIAQNLIGFDTMIFVLAALNVWIFHSARREADRLYQILHQTIFLPEHVAHPSDAQRSLNALKESDLVALRKRAESLYSHFVNVTGLFPLFGILGTVVSLIPMAADMLNMQQNFFAALTSTFWGLVFAIVFKAFDGFLGARMEDNEKNVALYLNRRPIRNEETPCATKESLST